MFTSIDKAIVAAIGALLFLIAEFSGWDFTGVTQEWIEGIVAILLPIIVWLVPNRKTALNRQS